MKLIGSLIVLSLVFTNCSHRQNSASQIINYKASLTGNLPFNPFRWCVISVAVDNGNSTMSTLYGNDIATRHARSDSKDPYPIGSQLSLVTWSQHEDDRWFGARTPAAVKSIEFVKVDLVTNGVPSYSYRSYKGSPLAQTAFSADSTAARIDDITSRRALVMP